MAKKKQQSPRVSQEDTIQAQDIFAHYHQIAQELHASTTRTQVEAALSAITELPESVQMALLKMLAKEPHTDSADILLALNETGSIKDVRKEAKRSLIQLQGAKMYPQWSLPSLPTEQLAPVEVSVVGNAPRFLQGKVTDTRAAGEVQVILAFEQGEGYKEVRVFGFLLEFWHDGVKDCFTRVDSKRSFENFMNRMTMEMLDVKMKNCSLAEGRRMLLEALAVNKKQGTMPHRDYRLHQSLINQFILENAAIDEDIEDEDIEDEDIEDDEDVDTEIDLDDEDDEDDEPISLDDLSPDKVVTTFVESWVDGDFDIAYELLASDSSLREGLSKEEWVERRDAWLEEAEPGELEPTFLNELKPQKSKLWLPNPKTPTQKVIEAAWSLELEETPLSETLPELPLASAVYEETVRHWYWATFTLVQDQGEWRIQSMTDEVKNARKLSAEELRARVQEHFNGITEITKKHKPTAKDAPLYMLEVIEHMMRAANYSDALIQKQPDDPNAYKEMIPLLFTLQYYERGLVYMEPFMRRFSEDRAINLRSMAAAQRILSEKYFDLEDDERGERFLELAEQALIESLSIEDNFDVRISLAEILIEEDERLDEAEEHLQRASTFTTEPADVAHIELHLGEIATAREQHEEAVQHYQRVVELQPDLADSWADLAAAYGKLDNLEEAETNYRHAIQLDPQNEDLYYALSTIFLDHDQPDKSLEVIKEGMSANPDSAIMSMTLALQYLERGDSRQAEIFMKQAEQLDPDAPLIKEFQQIVNLSKQKPALSAPKVSRQREHTPALSAPKFSRQQKKKRK